MADKYKEMAKKMKTELTNVRKLAIDAKKALTANKKLLVVANQANEKLLQQAAATEIKEADTLDTTNKQMKKLQDAVSDAKKLAIDAQKELTANKKLLVVANQANEKLLQQAAVAKEAGAATLDTTNKQMKKLQDAVGAANNTAKKATNEAIETAKLAEKEKQRTQNKIKELEQLIIACKSEMEEFEKLIQSTTDEEATAAAAFKKEMDNSLHNKSNLKF